MAWAGNVMRLCPTIRVGHDRFSAKANALVAYERNLDNPRRSNIDTANDTATSAVGIGHSVNHTNAVP